MYVPLLYRSSVQCNVLSMCFATFDKGICTHMKAIYQGCDLTSVERLVACQSIRHYTLATHLGKIRLIQPMLVHQEAQHIERG